MAIAKLPDVLLGQVTNKVNFLSLVKEDLRNMMDPDFELLGKLVSQQVLTDKERLRVKSDSNKTFVDRNDELLNVLIRKDDAAQRRFISCLHETNQHHVCYFINCDGSKHTFIHLFILSLVFYCMCHLIAIFTRM